MAAYSAWNTAFNRKYARAVADLYSDNTLCLPATHDVIEGSAGVEKFFTSLFAMGVTDHKLELINAREEGNLVYAAAKWSAKSKNTDGVDQPVGGVATHIFLRQSDDSLKLNLHIFN